MNERKGVHKIMAYNTLTEREAFYCLCHVPGFGSATIGKLRERFGTYQEVWTAKEQEIQKAGVLTEKRVTVFLQAREQESAWLKEFYGLERTGSALSLKETQTIRNVSFHIKTARRRFS